MPVSKYNPAQTDPGERARRFAARVAEIEILLEILRQNIGRSANQHVLLTGPRGIGKTTLLLRLVDILLEDPALARHWFPIVASEEIYRASSIGEFWLEMLFHLSRVSGDAGHAEAYQRLRRERDERRLTEAARGILLDFADARDRRLLLVVENLQMLLDGQMKDADGWALRETLIGEPRIMLLASAVSSFRQIEDAKAALFELFLVRPLEPLDRDECHDLWQKATGQTISKGRMRAIQILTGGNPRFLVMLSEFASTISLSRLMEDLVALIDDHTDYLKSNTEALPPIERKVFVSLAELWQDSTATEVAAEARLDVNTASAQLARLEKRGAVLSSRKGRSKRYRLAERLYNIYHLMRRHGDREARVRAAVEFMSALYDPDGRTACVEAIAREAIELPASDRAEHLLAIEHLVSRNASMASQQDIATVLRSYLSECQDLPDGLRKWLETQDAPEPGAAARGEEEVSAEELLASPPDQLDRPDLLVKKAALLWNDDPAAALLSLERAVDLDESYGPAWLMMSSVHGRLRRCEEALKAARIAVQIYRKRARERPDAFEADLAMSLNDLGIRYSELGRRKEALAATSRAVEIRERLAKEKPDAFEPDLAMSLNNLGNSYGELGRREEALAATSRAVEIRERLAKERPDAFEPKLAGSLNNLGNRYSKLGRREEALAATSRAVEIRERLAKERPDAFEPDLAMSLNNLGIRYSELGRREEALAATSRAVELYERLAKERPDAFERDLAMSLNNLGNMYSELGRKEEALEAATRAVEIRETLAKERPDAFEPDLAGSLSNLGNRYSELGRREEALAATSRAVELYERLAKERPDAFEPNLAGSLNNLGNMHGALGRREEALAATSRTVELYERLAKERPDAFEPDLAMSLNNLGNSYSALGRREEALAATSWTVELYERLAKERPDAFEPDLANGLNNLGNRYSELGRKEEALAAAARAVEIRERLAKERPDAFEPDLAGSLNVRETGEGEARRLRARPGGWPEQPGDRVQRVGEEGGSTGGDEPGGGDLGETGEGNTGRLRARPGYEPEQSGEHVQRVGEEGGSTGGNEESYTDPTKAHRRMAAGLLLPTLFLSCQPLGHPDVSRPPRRGRGCSA